MDPSIPVPSAKTTFTNIPLEIRYMIFTLVLKARNPLLITSARRKRRKPPNEPSPAKLHSLLLVNKQIHAEASPIFYNINSFTLGNNPSYFGSRSLPNDDGFKQFISRIPPSHLAAITSVNIELYLDSMLWFDPTRPRSNWVWRYGSYYDGNYFALIYKKKNPSISSFMTIVRAIANRFTGLRNIKISCSGERIVEISGNSKNMKALDQAMQKLLKLEKLRKVGFEIPVHKRRFIGDGGNFENLEKEMREKGKSLSCMMSRH